MLYDVSVDVPPSKYCINAIKEEKNGKRLFYGVPEEMFIEAAQYSAGRCGWASVGLIKGYLAKKGIAASRRGIAARLKALRGRGGRRYRRRNDMKMELTVPPKVD